MHFVDAIEDHQWARTNLTGHPGITTLWLGALGRSISFAVGLFGPEWEKGSVAYLALLRLPIAVVNSLAVVGGYLVLHRLLRPRTALLAALLWAGSPFIIAHSRLLHLDGLLTSCMTLSILFLLLIDHVDHIDHTDASPSPDPHTGPPPSPLFAWPLVASAICGGLAMLTKAPSLALLPIIGILLLFFDTERMWSGIRRATLRMGVWVAIAGVVVYIGWPAMWTTPTAALGHVIEEIVANGGQPHESGNFFLGGPTADPGVLFYPAVVLWRTTPFTLIGLLLVPMAIKHHPDERRTLLAVVGVIILFGGAMSILPKKFDRYLLPLFPMLAIAGAAGVWWLASTPRAQRFLNALATRAQQLPNQLSDLFSTRRIVYFIVGVCLFLTNLWYHPYYLSYFNPLLGGGRMASSVLLVGWGEGMEQVGAWLRTRPDLMRSPVMSWDYRTLEPCVPTRVVELNRMTIEQPASYAVLYVRGLQRNDPATAIEHIQQTPPLYVVREHGIDYAYVHQPIRPFDTPVDAVFGEGLHLRGFSIDQTNRQTNRQATNTLTVTLAWNVQTDQAGGLFSFLHVLNEAGDTVAQLDTPIDEGLYTSWQRGQQFGHPLPLTLPPDLEPGTYRVVLGVYHPADGHRLPLTQGEAMPSEVDGPDVVELTTVSISEE